PGVDRLDRIAVAAASACDEALRRGIDRVAIPRDHFERSKARRGTRTLRRVAAAPGVGRDVVMIAARAVKCGTRIMTGDVETKDSAIKGLRLREAPDT